MMKVLQEQIDQLRHELRYVYERLHSQETRVHEQTRFLVTRDDVGQSDVPDKMAMTGGRSSSSSEPQRR